MGQEEEQNKSYSEAVVIRSAIPIEDRVEVDKWIVRHQVIGEQAMERGTRAHRCLQVTIRK